MFPYRVPQRSGSVAVNHQQEFVAISQTVEHEPISRVSLSVALDSGKSASGSASVESQVAIPGLWEGVVSGESEVLEQ